jgi:CHASE3 domain sensor protein
VLSAQRQDRPPHEHRRHTIYAKETSGLLLIAFLLLVIILVRYWHAIHWSVR